MKLAIMQPYFFPYLGYFQLINSVDKFVIFDDVQYINRGWINSNRILLNNRCFNIVLPVKKDSQKRKINERYFVDDSIKYKAKILQQVEHAYKKAPFFKQIFPVISRLLLFEKNNVSEYNTFLLKELCDLLKITTPFYLSSGIDKNVNFPGEERMIHLNKIMGSTVCINPLGGMELYKRETFLNEGVELRFLKNESYSYKQFNNSFISDLSIIDILMFNSIESVNSLLGKYHLE
jgi:hypothetical protein